MMAETEHADCRHFGSVELQFKKNPKEVTKSAAVTVRPQGKPLLSVPFVVAHPGAGGRHLGKL